MATALAYIFGFATARQIVGRASKPLKYRANGSRAAQSFDKLVCDIACFKVRKDQCIGLPWTGLRALCFRLSLNERGVGLQLAVYDQLRRASAAVRVASRTYLSMERLRFLCSKKSIATRGSTASKARADRREARRSRPSRKPTGLYHSAICNSSARLLRTRFARNHNKKLETILRPGLGPMREARRLPCGLSCEWPPTRSHQPHGADHHIAEVKRVHPSVPAPSLCTPFARRAS